MMKYRGLFLALGLAALLGLTPPAAYAGNLTMTVTVGASSVTFDFTNATLAAAGSNANTLVVNVDALRSTFLQPNGSAYTFADLGAASNNPGQPSPTGGTLSETGTAILNGTGSNNVITVAVSQTAFTVPLGPGSLGFASGALFTNATTGNTEVTSSSFNAGSTPPVTLTYDGLRNPEQLSNNGSQGGLTAVGSYSLDNSATITLTGNSTTKDQFTVSAVFNAAVPEPASLVLMVTGMPLPLVVMGLLRRRRAAA